MNFALATLDLKEMEKFLWEGMEKGLPYLLSQFRQNKLRQPSVIGKMQKKSGIMKSGLDAMPLFLQDNLLRSPHFLALAF